MRFEDSARFKQPVDLDAESPAKDLVKRTKPPGRHEMSIAEQAALHEQKRQIAKTAIETEQYNQGTES